MSLVQLLGFGEQGWGSTLLLALLMTVVLTIAALAVGAVFGAMVAAAKLSRSRTLRILGDAYTTLFRGIPELLIIYLFYFGGSSLMTAVGHFFGADGSIGMSTATLWRRVLIPQVIRFALPGIGNVWQLSLKDSALIAVTGLAELMRTSQVAAGSTHQYFTFYKIGRAHV